MQPQLLYKAAEHYKVWNSNHEITRNSTN